MASNERNALVELAYVLQWHVDECGVYRGVPTMQLHEAISKAHRIISELAKVKFGDYGLHENDFDVDVVLSTCRAIAEEVAGDERCGMKNHNAAKASGKSKVKK